LLIFFLIKAQIILHYSTAYVLFVSDYFGSQSKLWHLLLAEQILFPIHPIVLPGSNVWKPQDVCLYGDSQVLGLTYGPLKREPKPMPPILLHICSALKRFCAKLLGAQLPSQANLNLVLVNRYVNGKDSMGMHADIEPSLGATPYIVSLSLGASCKFQFKHKTTGNTKDIPLKDGSLIIMIGWDIQNNWKHGVPKTKKQSGMRWNLSFRYHEYKNK